MPKHITKEQKERIIDYYKMKPITISEVANHFKISDPSVIKILNEFRIKRYSKVQLFSPELIENYFESIDTEFKAYFLGLIITDGCIHNTKGKQSLVSITLCTEDEYLLERFKQEIRSNKAITHDGRGCSEINILSNKMVGDLKKYGITTQKSLFTKFPDNVPADLYPHLIRGILDGDGSVSFYSRKDRKRCHTKAVRFCQGNETFLKDLVYYLEKNVSVKSVNLYKEKENLWSIAYRKNDSMVKLIRYMYDDAHIYMKRKKHLCDLIIEEIQYYGSTEITNNSKRFLVS